MNLSYSSILHGDWSGATLIRLLYLIFFCGCNPIGDPALSLLGYLFLVYESKSLLSGRNSSGDPALSFLSYLFSIFRMVLFFGLGC